MNGANESIATIDLFPRHMKNGRQTAPVSMTPTSPFFIRFNGS